MGGFSEQVIQRVALVVKLEERSLDVRLRLSTFVPIDGVCYLAGRQDVVGVKTVLLQAEIGHLDESEPAPRLFLECDSDCVVAHKAEVLEEGG